MTPMATGAFRTLYCERSSTFSRAKPPQRVPLTDTLVVLLIRSIEGVHAQSSVTLLGVVATGPMYRNQNSGTGRGEKSKDSVTMFTGSAAAKTTESAYWGRKTLVGARKLVSR